MEIDVLTLFPEIFESPLKASILGKAIDSGKVRVTVHNLRKWTSDKHATADDKPYGGGPGMVMKPEPIFKAVEELKREETKLLLMSPQGRLFNQRLAEEFSKERHILVICGHYEGIDERVIRGLSPFEVSIGKYVLTNGAVAALVVIDAVSRLVEGVLGNSESAAADSFSTEMLDFPHYTRPRIFRGMEVPPVLLSGNHEQIACWRNEQAMQKTKHRNMEE